MKLEEAIKDLQSRVEQLEVFQQQSVALITYLQEVLGVSLLDKEGNLQADLIIPEKGKTIGYIPRIEAQLAILAGRKIKAPNPLETQRILKGR